MSQEAEPSIIDYARFYGLIRDHLKDNPLEQFSPPRDLFSDLEDNSNLFQIRADSVRVPDERLAFDEGAASVLSSAIALAKQPPSTENEDDEINVHRVRRMKHEIPLLRTDPEVDLLRFAPRIVPNLENEFLPLETVDEEADEGFDWPTWCSSLPEEYAKKLKAEKLKVTSDALVFLQEALNFQQEGGEQQILDHAELAYGKRTKIQHVSPPLLPMSPEALPFLPSSDTGLIELLSDHSSPTKEEARAVESLIFADGAIARAERESATSPRNSEPMPLDSETIGDIYSPLKDAAEPPFSSPVVRRSLQDRKVEVPLSPPRSEQPPPWKRKSVSFREALSEVTHNLPPLIPDPANVSSDDIDAFFEETIRPIGVQAERRIEQERLQEADTTLRVPIPVMDSSLPIAPWKAATQGPENTLEKTGKNFLSEMKAHHFSNHVWPLSGKVERELKWTPFPAALGKVANQETISDDSFIEEYLAQPDRVDIDTLAWKPEGLRVLDELAKSDGELEEGTFPDERDIDSLIRKRKYELQADDSSSPPVIDEYGTSKVRHRSNQTEEELCKGRAESEPAMFSALSALDSYMRVRKGEVKKPEPTADKHFPATSKVTPPADALEPTKPTIAPPTARPDIPLPSPAFTPPTFPTPFVISTSFLSNRKLTRRILHFYPTADFIERDFNLHLDPQSRPPSNINITPAVHSTMADEADVILSPSFGLIWTTLQKIKQRSLPGQVARSAVRERIARVSPRYERVIVLVHEGRNSFDASDIGGSELDTSDCSSLIDLTTFCSSLPSEIQIAFIAGGEEDLAKWIVALMVKYGITDPNLKLIQEETLWEVFLRRAGMNAFAAQAILSELKAPEGSDGGMVWEFGLGAFVKMVVRERFERFERLLGGRGVLGRVSRVLDAKW